MARSLGLLCSADRSRAFADEAPENRYFDSVNAVVRAGLASGFPDGTADPARPITRAEWVVLLVKMLDASGVDLAADVWMTSFTDQQTIPVWAKDAMERSLRLGLFKGEPAGGFRPNDLVTREEAAVMLFRFLRKIGAVD